MDQRTLDRFRETLIERGRSVLRRRQRALADESQLLAEREPDWEDLAAEQSAAAVLESLSEADRMAVARIRASLVRIDRGTYGTCLICHGPIDEERLRAVPEADLCGGCTTGD
jgi:RNA polymerase-binding transcription factor DksA